MLVAMSVVAVTTRLLEPADAEAVAAVHESAWREAYCGIIPGLALEKMIVRRGPGWWQRAAANKRAILVIEVGGEVAGYSSFGLARLSKKPGIGEIQELYLAPQYQGLGLGKRLFHASVARLRSHKCTGLLIRSLADNERAVEFYRRRGGRIVARDVEKIGGRELPTVIFRWAL
jgi:ribosomal protein S18 acetylase RimI-like enzyme